MVGGASTAAAFLAATLDAEEVLFSLPLAPA